MDLKKSVQLSHENFSEILLLENLRFFNGEQGTTKERIIFCDLLSTLADVYINDAFALYHRDDSSVKSLSEKFTAKNKAYGLLFENEVHNLNKIKHNPKQPFVFILGGNKLETKMPLLQRLFKKNKIESPHIIIIGGSISHPFLSARDSNFQIASVTSDQISLAQAIITEANNKNIKIILPVDHVTKKGVFQTNNFPKNKTVIDIGPKTIKLFENEILKAKTIFVNGVMGIYQNAESQNGTLNILNAIANSDTYKVAGGGDCVAAIHMFNLQNKFDFLSTGGGATLKFIS